jgi:nickel-dependent lactate racemase
MRNNTQLQLRYGATVHDCVLPSHLDLVPMEPRTEPPAAAPAEILQAALASPAGSPPLRELARGKRTAAIMVPGQDRVAAAEQYLPCIMNELNAGGIDDDGITFYLATGTHAKHTPSQIAAVLGAEAAARAVCREHDCRNPAALHLVGRTRRGNDVRFNRAVVDADIKVLTGRIIPHYFAGFGGGRKALLPGVAAFETIVHNHRLTLAPERGIRQETHACRLADNPVHLDMVEAARLMPGTKFVVNTLLDAGHRLVGAVAGELEAAHLAGCERAASMFAIPIAQPLDGAVACAGGSPYDCNFMQAIKALFDARDAVRPGGPMLCVAECPAGIQPGFLQWAAIQDDAELDKAVRAGYNLTGHNSILIRQLVRQRPVALWSRLPDAAVEAMGIVPIHSMAEGIDWLAGEMSGSRCGIMPFANITYAFNPAIGEE